MVVCAFSGGDFSAAFFLTGSVSLFYAPYIFAYRLRTVDLLPFHAAFCFANAFAPTTTRRLPTAPGGC